MKETAIAEAILALAASINRKTDEEIANRKKEEARKALLRQKKKDRKQQDELKVAYERIAANQPISRHEVWLIDTDQAQRSGNGNFYTSWYIPIGDFSPYQRNITGRIN